MKRYHIVGKPGRRFFIKHSHAGFKDLAVVWWDNTQSCWYYEGLFGLFEINRKCSVTLEGIGEGGPILSVLSGNYALVGELVTDKLTGSSNIRLTWKRDSIDYLPSKTPLAARDQAVQMFASKWISLKREAM